ncbi:MAG: ATP-binding cassette domain-containing protein [Caldimonas sp.]
MSFSLDGAGFVHPNGHRALQGVSLALAQGERAAVIGPSGAGKTTLVRVLGTSLRPGEGRVAIAGVDPWSLGARELRRLRARIGVVHQSPPIPARLRVVTAVLAGRLGTWSLWRSLASLLVPADAAGARDALARLDLGERVFDRCDRLSGGQLQRVGIARVLYQQPDVILADEPVSALDPTLADASVGALVEASEASRATLLASLHAVDLAVKWFPRLIGMKGGQVVFDRPTAAVTSAMLHDLYATEGRALPMQGVDGDAHERARAANVLVLKRPGCQ